MRRVAYIVLLCLACLGLGPLAGTAGAAPPIESSSFTLSSGQAGAHADLSVSVTLQHPGFMEVIMEAVKDLLIDLPPGYFIYPSFHARCTATQWDEAECPVGSQVGLVTVRGSYKGDHEFVLGTAPVHLLAPEGEELARLGFVVPTIEVPVEVPVTPRPGDYALNLALESLPAAVPLQSLALTLWGVPADAAHDEERFPGESTADPPGCPGSLDASCVGAGTPSLVAPIPFLRSPTFCSGAGPLEVKADSYENPGDFSTSSTITPVLSNCSKIAFPVEFAAALASAETSASTGLSLDVQIAGNVTPGGVSASDVKAISVSLPAELALDEEALAGLTACSPAQASLGEDGPSECPPASKIGTVAAAVLGAEAPLAGDLFFGGAESPGSYRLFLIAAGGGIDLRLQALLEYDEASGSWEIALSNLPQIPFEELELEVASALGLFVTPAECGTFEVTGDFTPWKGGEDLHAIDELTMETGPAGGPCPGPAEEIVVSLDPSSIPADGLSTSTATATVLDANSYLLDGEEVVFTSTDPEQLIGPVTDHGDGTYTAQITASTEPGVTTIFAFDKSVEPEAFGFADLTQLALPPPPTPPVISPLPPAPPSATPIVKFLRRPPAQTRDRTPTFRFASSVPGSTFECKVDRRRLRACKSPLTLPRLSFGRHTFKVRAIAPGDIRSPFASHSFRVRRP